MQRKQIKAFGWAGLAFVLLFASSAEAALPPSPPLGLSAESTTSLSDADVQRLAAAPLAEACARLDLAAERLLPSLPLANPGLTHVVASAFARMLETSVALDGPVPLFGSILALRNFPSLGRDPREAARWLDHLRALDLEPRLEDLASQARLAQRLQRVGGERLTLTLSALSGLMDFSGRLGDADHLVGQIEALPLDDLRRLVDLIGEQTREQPRRHRSLSEATTLVQEVVREGRWRTPAAAPDQPVGGFSFGQAQFGAARFASASNFQPAGAGRGGLSEHARGALDVLEQREAAATQPDAVEAAILAAREAILATAPGTLPGQAAGLQHGGRRRQQVRVAEALSALEQLATAAPMVRTTAVRTDRRPLEGGQVVALVWRSIEGFPANVSPQVAGERWAGLDATTLAAFRASWRSAVIDSLASCASVAGNGEPYGAIERLLSDLPPFLRSDCDADLEAFLPRVDVDQLVAELASARPEILARTEGTSPAEAAVVHDWRREMWMGICEAHADRLWPAASDPRRHAFLARCRQQADLE